MNPMTQLTRARSGSGRGRGPRGALAASASAACPGHGRLCGSILVAVALGGIATAAAARDLSDTHLLPDLGLFGKKDDVPYLYGQVNKGVLVHDDGQSTEVYPLVDNNNSSTRGGIRYERNWASGLNFMMRAEGEWTPYSTSFVSQVDDDIDFASGQLRRLEMRFDFEDLGKFWAGQGSMASDNSAEQDLSGTSLIAYASVADSAAGQLLALADGGLSDTTIGNSYSDLDGLGRRMRLAYDTPSWRGAFLSTSVGYNALDGDTEIEWDAAASYVLDKPGSDLSVNAKAAFSRPKGVDNRFSGSVSVLHKPTGLSLTMASGFEDRNRSDRSPSYFYGKLGYRPDLTSLGPTSLAVDGYIGNNFNIRGSDSLTFSVSAVQTIAMADVGFDLYATLRHYGYDEPDVDFDSALSMLTGIRWRF